MSNPQSDDASHFAPVLAPEVQPRTIKQYIGWLDGFLPKDDFRRNCVLFTCAQLARQIAIMNSFTGTISIQAVATALFGLRTLSSIKYPLLQDEPTLPAEERLARVCINEAHGVEKDEYLLARTDEERRRETLFYLNWKLSSEAQYQGDGVYQIPNALVLSGLEGFGGLQAEPNRINELFQAALGISAREFFLFLFAIWSYSANRNAMLNTISFLDSSVINPDARDKFSKIFQELSFQVDDSLGSPEFEFLKFNSGQRIGEALFTRNPYMKVSEKHYLAAGHPFLKAQMTHKFLQKAFAIARKIEKTQKPTLPYSQYVGERLERFFEELCIYWNPPDGQFSEYFYLQDSKIEENKSSDRIVFEKFGESEIVILFQVKTKTLQEKSFYGVSIDGIDKDIKIYSEFVYKSINYLYLLDKGLREGKLREEHKTLSERVLSAKKCCLIGITPIDPAIFTNVAMRRQLIWEVRAALDKKDVEIMKWFMKKYGSTNCVGWHIMGIDQFESFLTLPPHQRNFSDCFQRYLESSRIDYELANSQGEIPDTFRGFVIKHFKQTRHTPLIGALQNVFHQYADQVAEFFFQHRANGIR